MKERFPLRRTIKRIVVVENTLNTWIEHYTFLRDETGEFAGTDPFHDRVDHLVRACKDLQTAAFELEYIKRP